MRMVCSSSLLAVSALCVARTGRFITPALACFPSCDCVALLAVYWPLNTSSPLQGLSKLALAGWPRHALILRSSLYLAPAKNWRGISCWAYSSSKLQFQPRLRRGHDTALSGWNLSRYELPNPLHCVNATEPAGPFLRHPLNSEDR